MKTFQESILSPRMAVSVGSNVSAAAAVGRAGSVRGRSSGAPGQKSGAFDPKVIAPRIAMFLRSKHPTKTAVHVAADIGCGVPQAEKWLELASLPNCAAFMRLISGYGPEFLAALFPTTPAWLDAALNAERAARIDEEIARRQREIEELMSRAR